MNPRAAMAWGFIYCPYPGRTRQYPPGGSPKSYTVYSAYGSILAYLFGGAEQWHGSYRA